jgi:hypothetical protein
MLRRLAGGAATVRSSSAAAAFRRLLHTGSGGGCGSGETESVAYRMSMLRRPSSVGKKGLTWNSCSLIGRLAAPVTPYEGSCEDDPVAYTFLSVSPSSSAASSSSNFRFESLSTAPPANPHVLCPLAAAEFFSLEIRRIVLSLSGFCFAVFSCKVFAVTDRRRQRLDCVLCRNQCFQIVRLIEISVPGHGSGNSIRLYCLVD